MNPSDWQTTLPTVRERNEYAFNGSLFCDVKFSVMDMNGDKVTVPANKYVLAISSPVFEAMFFGQLHENKSIIDLPDCSEEGLREMLRYMYSDKVVLSGNNVMEVLYLAEKYMMPFLMKKCNTYLQDEVGPDDVLSILPQVQNVGDNQLQKHLWGIVDRETFQMLSSNSFLKISKELLCQILARDTLNINEMALFHAVDRWASEKIKEKGLEVHGETKRNILGNKVIKLIRFPLMANKEFTEEVIPSGILHNDELRELEQLFGNVSLTTNMFSNKKRGVDCLLIPCIRFHTIKEPSWMYTGLVDTIEFTTSKALYLISVQLFGSEGSRYDVDLKIYHKNSIISQISSSFLSKVIDDLFYGFNIDLIRPVKLDPRTIYTVEAKISGPPSHCGYHGKHTILADDVRIIYKNSSSEGSVGVCTSVSCGQFPTLIFQKI